jgi:plastocyanin
VTTVAFLAFAPGVARAGQVVEVHVTSNVFTPEFVEIHQGDTVRWIFDQGTHDTVSVGGEWNSGYLGPGGVYEYRFTGTGQYDYYCSIHIDCCNMMGSVYVLPKDRVRPVKTETGN